MRYYFSSLALFSMISSAVFADECPPRIVSRHINEGNLVFCDQSDIGFRYASNDDPISGQRRGLSCSRLTPGDRLSQGYRVANVSQVRGEVYYAQSHFECVRDKALLKLDERIAILQDSIIEALQTKDAEKLAQLEDFSDEINFNDPAANEKYSASIKRLNSLKRAVLASLE